jgi:hypothetical protein
MICLDWPQTTILLISASQIELQVWPTSTQQYEYFDKQEYTTPIQSVRKKIVILSSLGDKNFTEGKI